MRIDLATTDWQDETQLICKSNLGSEIIKAHNPSFVKLQKPKCQKSYRQNTKHHKLVKYAKIQQFSPQKTKWDPEWSKYRIDEN